MITKATGYRFGEQFFATIEDAQKAALLSIWNPDTATDKVEADGAITWMLANKEQIMDILTMRPTSKPALRKINGAKRKARAAAAKPEPHPLELSNIDR